MVQPPFPFSTHLSPPPTPSASTPPLLPPLCSNSKAYLHNLYNYVTHTLRLTADQYQTHSDLVPTRGHRPSNYGGSGNIVVHFYSSFYCNYITTKNDGPPPPPPPPP